MRGVRCHCPANKDTDVAREITVLDQVISSRKTLSFDSIFSSIASVPPEDVESRYSSLTEEDFAYVADKLDVEVAAIKAVVLIEAGTQMKGFWSPGVPVANFDRKMYARFRKKGGREKEA